MNKSENTDKNEPSRREIFLSYLVKKIGFNHDTFLEDYLRYLSLNIPKLKQLGRKNKILDGIYTHVEDPKPNTEYFDMGDYYIPKRFSIIDYLLIEIKIKKKSEFKLKEKSLKYISATDLANFTFCPISFAISSSFELPKYEAAILGTSQHEKNRLLYYLKPDKVSEFYAKGEKNTAAQNGIEHSYNEYLNSDNEHFFNDVSNSSILFFGHNDNEIEKKYFKSHKGLYIGQPDYIFKNEISNNIYVVEEKFQFTPKDPSSYYYITEEEGLRIEKKRARKVFFDNHINQLSSYIYGIHDYEIEYGYLVYWKYELHNKTPKIISCNVLKIARSENGKKNIQNVYSDLRHAINKGGGDFDVSKRLPAKCAGCVSNILCGHKTGRFSNYKIPYSLEHLKPLFIPFPEELKDE